MGLPAEKRPPAEEHFTHGMTGGPPHNGPASNAKFVRFLSELFRDWFKEQDPKQWISKDSE